MAGRAGDTARVARAATLPGSRLQVAGAGLLTLAVLLWASGFILLPWAEANTCTGSHLTLVHFVRAGCAAMDSGDAVGTALTGLLVHPGPATENFYYQIPLALFYAVVAAGALPLLAGVWGWCGFARGEGLFGGLAGGRVGAGPGRPARRRLGGRRSAVYGLRRVADGARCGPDRGRAAGGLAGRGPALARYATRA